MKLNRHGRSYCKIVLTGGPCSGLSSGKSTAQAMIASRIARDFNETWRVFTVTEAASLLYKGRVQRSTMDEEQIKQWQEDILRTIFHLESVYEHIAENEEHRNTLIVCDRAGMDPKAYVKSQTQWNGILKRVGLTEKEILGRYECVIRLFTAPKEVYENRLNNAYRRENYDQAQQIDRKYNEIWEGHRHLFKISDKGANSDQTEGWNKKFEAIFDIVRSVMHNSLD